MTSDVVLTAALRNNLLSLQNTQGQIDITQFRLATGRKINSALDGPQAFFAAQALNNRASDLTRLLDAMGQSIQVIKAADNGITALTKLVEQADSIANGARDALAQGQSEAKVVGTEDLRGIDDLTLEPGIANGDTLVLSVTDDDGNAINLGSFSSAAASATATATITITNPPAMSVDDLIAAINDLHLDNGSGVANGPKAFEASLNEKGQLQIRTLNGGDFNLRFEATGGGGTDAADLVLAEELGFGGIARLVGDGAGNNTTQFTALADVALASFAFYSNTTVPPQIAQASALLSTIVDSSGAINRFANLDNPNDDYIISINGGSQVRINLTDGAGAPLSIQSFVDQINNSSALNEHIEASYDDETGVLSLEPIGGEVVSIEIGVSGDDPTIAGNGPLTANFGFGVNTALTAGAAGQAEIESIRLAAAAADLAQFETDYNRIRDQIDLLVEDTGYRGTNLLNGDNLFTVFNEFRTSTLTTNGVTFTAEGLGLSEANFSRISSTEAALTEVRDALETVRNFGLTLAADLGVIQARENFTKTLVVTLNEGADKLTIADQNEEGAKLLALQTRQQLGVTSLSLASQSQQSILRLF